MRCADAGAIWLLGLPAAGKTTTARALAVVASGRGRAALVLDGDGLRSGLNVDLGFTRADRVEAARRAAHASVLVAQAGALAITAMVTPYEEARARVRAVHRRASVPLLEVWVATPLDVCVARDPKGLYAAAAAGALEGLTGVSDTFDVPADADVTVAAAGRTPDDLAQAILAEARARWREPREHGALRAR